MDFGILSEILRKVLCEKLQRKDLFTIKQSMVYKACNVVANMIVQKNHFYLNIMFYPAPVWLAAVLSKST